MQAMRMFTLLREAVAGRRVLRKLCYSILASYATVCNRSVTRACLVSSCPPLPSTRLSAPNHFETEHDRQILKHLRTHAFQSVQATQELRQSKKYNHNLVLWIPFKELAMGKGQLCLLPCYNAVTVITFPLSMPGVHSGQFPPHL